MSMRQNYDDRKTYFPDLGRSEHTTALTTRHGNFSAHVRVLLLLYYHCGLVESLPVR